MLTLSPIYGSLLALIVLVLALRVVKFRRAEKVGFGHENGSRALQCAIRAHANAVENIPLAMLLLVMLELNHLAPWIQHLLGFVLVLGRTLHAWGLSTSSGVSPGRFYGTLLSWFVLLAMIIINLLVVLTR
jgi:uncharacterized membrane protein YecN with MAPEG domain